MTLCGVDLNASRVRAVSGPIGDFPLTLPLDPPRAELPLAFSLEGYAPEIGAAGLRLCRQAPHLACINFLPSLGDRKTIWNPERHSLDASRAVSLLLQYLRSACGGATGVLLSLPAYLTLDQIRELTALAHRAG